MLGIEASSRLDTRLLRIVLQESHLTLPLTVAHCASGETSHEICVVFTAVLLNQARALFPGRRLVRPNALGRHEGNPGRGVEVRLEPARGGEPDFPTAAAAEDIKRLKALVGTVDIRPVRAG